MSLQSLQLQLIRRILEINDPEVLQWLATMLQGMPPGLVLPDHFGEDTLVRQSFSDPAFGAKEIQQSIDEFFNPSVEE